MRALQRERFADDWGVATNSAMNPKDLKKWCQLDKEGGEYLDHAMNEMDFSARAYDRILKVARTLADLDAEEKILANHVLEGIQYRSLDRDLWS
ncbi:MAG: magnesium chelatase subunit ChlI family protein [Verrucomicrobiales bacterium]